MSDSDQNLYDVSASVSLMDIGPLTPTVKIRNRNVSVYGLSALDIFDMLQRYPEVRAVMEQKFKDITPDALWKLGPQVVLRLMAIGLTKKSDFMQTVTSPEGMVEIMHSKKYEDHLLSMIKQILNLSMGEQIKVLTAVLEATMPDGRDPFVMELNKIRELFSGTLEDSQETSAPVTTSPVRSPATFSREDPNYKFGPQRRANLSRTAG